MVTSNQKSTLDKHAKRKSNPNTTLNIAMKAQEKKTRKKTNKNKSKTIHIMAIKAYISIFALNANGFHAPVKRPRLDK